MRIARPALPRSLAGRLALLWLLSVAACMAVGVVLVQLYSQSTSARVRGAEALVARGCDAIRDRYGFYTSGVAGPVTPDAGLRRDLHAVVALALARLPGVEGGIWQEGSGSLAYAYPTYEGGGPKTDLPEAERGRLESINEAAAQDGQAILRRHAARRQTMLQYACPLSGPLTGATAWTMMRVDTEPGFGRLTLAIGVLLALMLVMAAWLALLAVGWRRRIAAIERTLAAHGPGSLPHLALSGAPELDRLIIALNEAGARLAEARANSDALADRAARAERLAALGRMAAGMAHEIRNPVAAMRLRAENALAGDEARRKDALHAILAQLARLDRLIGELLAMTQRPSAVARVIALPDTLRAALIDQEPPAEAAQVALVLACDVAAAKLDAGLLRRIAGALLENAVRHTPPGGTVCLSAAASEGKLRIAVTDSGPGVPAALRASLFEPFVSGRADGTGLGLAIARELATALGGTLTLKESARGAVFVLEGPWLVS